MVFSCSKIYGVVPQTRRFKKRLASLNLANYKVVEPGDLVYDPMLLWDASIGFVREPGPGVVSPAYATFEFNASKGERSFFTHALFSHRLRHQYRAISRGTNVRRKKAMPAEFLNLKIPVPTQRREQQAIGGFFDMVDSEIDLLVRLGQEFDALKRGMLRFLVSGRPLRTGTPDADGAVTDE